MKKKKEFLNNLDIELEKSGMSKKKRNAIVLKYKNIIEERMSKKEKIYSILKEIGTPESIAEKEIINNKFDIKKSVNNFIEKITKDYSLKDIIKIKEKKEVSKSLFITLNKTKDSFIKTYRVVKEKIVLNKNKSNPIIIEKKEINEIPKTNEVEELSIINEDKILNENNDDLLIENENVLLEEQYQESNNDDYEYERNVYYIQEKPKKKLIIRILQVLLVIVLALIWQWSGVLTFASLFAILDGVKLTGIFITIFGISSLFLWLLLFIIDKLYKKIRLFRFKIIIVLPIIVIISFGMALSIYQIYKLDKVSDLSDKYSMSTQSKKYNLPKGENNKMYIIFNSFYDTQYIVNYDDTLDGTFKLEINYYEAYYDFYEKNSGNNIYISLRKDNRDILSTYINGLKDGKIYSDKELLRYVVRITISKKDYERLVIED